MYVSKSQLKKKERDRETYTYKFSLELDNNTYTYQRWLRLTCVETLLRKIKLISIWLKLEPEMIIIP